MSIPPRRMDHQSPTVQDQRQPAWIDRQSRVLPPLPQEPPIHTSTPTAKMSVDDTVASTDLQNPADALEFLAHVAQRSGSNQLPPLYGYSRPQLPSMAAGILNGTSGNTELPSGSTEIDYPPLQKGQLSYEMVTALLARYEDKYHQFFPIANPAAMDPRNLPDISMKEPHLLAAILTVASKDEKDWWSVHEACSAHMQQRIAELVYSGVGSVEAVEAMLILAEWVPRRPNSTSNVGRGEEDNAAWMYVGTAIRLGYLLGIDRTGFRGESEAASADLNRKRLAWATCYTSDRYVVRVTLNVGGKMTSPRQISVRIGKAFWSRGQCFPSRVSQCPSDILSGPGPMTALRAQDFPSLQPRLGRNDDYAAIFQANLELTQLFSNAHDVLYATKSRSSQLNFGGEYVKYIDDFRVSKHNE